MIKAWPKYIFFIVLIHTFSFISFSKYKKITYLAISVVSKRFFFLDIVNAIKWKNQTINWRTTKFAVLLILFIIYGNFQWTSSEKDIIIIKVMWTLTFYCYVTVCDTMEKQRKQSHYYKKMSYMLNLQSRSKYVMKNTHDTWKGKKIEERYQKAITFIWTTLVWTYSLLHEYLSKFQMFLKKDLFLRINDYFAYFCVF